MKKQKLENPHRFWSGIGIVAAEILGLGIFGLTRFNYDWFTIKLVQTIGIVLPIILLNILAMILIWNGSQKSVVEKKRK